MHRQRADGSDASLSKRDETAVEGGSGEVRDERRVGLGEYFHHVDRARSRPPAVGLDASRRQFRNHRVHPSVRIR